ncbi:DEAD/DEAH box helicase [Burkholderia sp. AW49-1]
MKYTTDGAAGWEVTPRDGGCVIQVLNKEPSNRPTVADAAILKLAAPQFVEDTFDVRAGRWLQHVAMERASQAADGGGATRAVASWRDAFSYVRENQENGVIGLRLPQEGALHAIHAHWSTSDGVASIVMPTGTGKTEVMLATLVSASCTRLLVVVPTDALRSQVADKFLTLGVLKLPNSRVLASSAQYPVVGILEHAPKTVEAAQSFFEACNVVVTTSHIAGRCEPAVQVCMAELCSHLFIDEAHHVEAPTWKAFKANFSTRRVLQFTATPFREDDHPIDGKIIYAYPLRKAQDEGYFRPIRFSSVFEFDSGLADRKIAEKVVAELDSDATGKHVAMARVGSIDRALEVHALYASIGRFSPVVLHSRLGQHERRESLQKLRTGTSRIVVCVDMLGEGFDMPELKIAAFHDVRKSLSVTLQLAGRFTRVRSDVGNATFIANTADVEVQAELRKLYTQDPDWNTLLPQLSETAIAGEVATQEFLSGFGNFPAEIPLQELKPAASMVVYRTRCSVWSPEKFGKGLYAVRPADQVHHSINHDARVLVVVSGSQLPVAWTDVESIRDWGWELFVAAWDAEQSLLFIHGSGKNGEYRSLAKALCGEDVELVTDPVLYRCFHGVTRLLLTNLGLNEQFGRQVRFTGRMGADVASRLPDAAKQNARKAVISGMGYENGATVTIGAAKRGRVWSFQRLRLDAFVRWCKHVGAKIIDDSIDPEAVLNGTLVPEIAASRPPVMPIAVDWPEVIYTERESVLGVKLDGSATELEFYRVSIDVDSPTLDGPLRFRVLGESSEATFELRLSADDQTIADYRFVEISKRSSLKRNSAERGMVEFFDEHPPVFWFADGSSLEGNQLVRLRSTIAPFNRERIQAWDWSSTDIRKESQGVTREADSIQYRVIEKLRSDGMYQIIFDDDGAGESADVVTATMKEENGRPIIEVEFYHCKYAGDATPRAQVDDLYEVCGQAQKSIAWLHGQLRRTDLFLHWLRREPKVRRGIHATRYQHGTRDTLIAMKEASRMAELKLRIFIVQPGLSKERASDAQLALLSVTENYLLETYGVPFGVVGSA